MTGCAYQIKDAAQAHIVFTARQSPDFQGRKSNTIEFFKWRCKRYLSLKGACPSQSVYKQKPRYWVDRL